MPSMKLIACLVLEISGKMQKVQHLTYFLNLDLDPNLTQFPSVPDLAQVRWYRSKRSKQLAGNTKIKKNHVNVDHIMF